MKRAVVLSCDDHFVSYATILAKNIIKLSNNSITIIILSDYISDENKIASKIYCAGINFVEIGSKLDELSLYIFNRITRSTYARLLIDEVLSDFERIIYLDCDITLIGDISNLFSIKHISSPVIATYSMHHSFEEEIYARLPLNERSAYLQAGVLILDLKSIREERIFKEALRFILENPESCIYHDQDALNVALQGRWQVLDWRWNVTNFDFQILPDPYYLRHHTGYEKPWCASTQLCERSILEQWRSDLANSPWPSHFFPEPFHVAAKRIRRRVTRPIVDMLGMTPRWRVAQNERMAVARREAPQRVAVIERLARDGALAERLPGLGN